MNEPFRDTAKKLSGQTDYLEMYVRSDRARSHGWWKNLVVHGAWRGPGSTRVGPPDPEAIPGIARLFGTTEEEVAAMIAADWYQVDRNAGISAAARRLGPALDALDDDDLARVEDLVRRLAAGRPPKAA